MVIAEEARFAGRFAGWEPLGEGGEARLYRVQDRWTGRVAALKLSREDAAAPSIRHEFSLLSRFRHPALIESRDLIRDDAAWAHLLEYVPAVDPRTLWEAGGERAVRAALVQSIRGLGYLHRHGYVHGDVSPANILVWREGDRWRAKVADLGLALPVDEAARAAVRGTAGYMAPEVARGEGTGPGADWYGLALTAVLWVDGVPAYEELSAAEVLKRVAAAGEAPRPRRRVSPELSRLLALLGPADPRARGAWNWKELREDAAFWGPPVLAAGVAGVDDATARWSAWAEESQEGRPAGLIVRGRVGSGRRTAAEAFVRSRVAAGWTALWDLPLGALRDWLDLAEGDPDPVRLARELVRRFEGKHVVLLWPERTAEVESRLLRAFVTSRGAKGSAVRTCVVKIAGLHREDDDATWLVKSVRAREEVWEGPGPVGMSAIRDDLFPGEEGLREAAPREAGSSPLSLVLLKQARVAGREVEAVVTGEAAVDEDVRQAWGVASAAARAALAVLCRSDGAWGLELLGGALGWDRPAFGDVREEFSRLHLTRREYTSEGPQESVADWLVRGRLRALSEATWTPAFAGSLGARLEADSLLHPEDLALLLALTVRGAFPRGYAAGAFKKALADGRYDAVLETWRGMEASAVTSVGDAVFVWEAALRAAQRIGRFADEVAALRGLLSAGPELEAALRYRHMLAEALYAAGDWEEAVKVCDETTALAAAPTRDRLWARIQKAKYQWRSGKVDEARATYEAVEPELGEDPEILRLYYVGRARFATELSDPSLALSFLDQARKRLGPAACDADPLYLHARAGALKQIGDQHEAEPLAKRAVELTEASSRWTDYVLVASRASHIVFELGKPLEAHRIGNQVLAIAITLRSEWQVLLAELGLGFTEVALGEFGSALRRVQKCREAHPRIAQEGERLAAFLASRSGLSGLMEEATTRLRQNPDESLHVFADQCEGIYFVGAEAWDKAAERLQSVAEYWKRTGQEDSEAMARSYLALGLVRLGRAPMAEENYRMAQGVFGKGKYPLFQPVHQIIASLLGWEADPASIVAGLRADHRLTDLVFWGGSLLASAAVHRDLASRKAILEAIQSVSGSFEDPNLRKQFLGFPSTRRTLAALQRPS